MIYLDTSALVPLIVPEASSPKIKAWRDGLSERHAKELTLSVWALTEFASAMGLKVRNRELTRQQGESAVAFLRDEVAPKLNVLEVSATDFRLAEAMLQEFSLGLRAGDALHLAIASSGATSQFVCLDRQLARAGAALGVKVFVPV